MAAVDAVVAPMSESEHQKALRRAVIASTVGTTIEWYDFLMYSTVTGLVFGKVYFPQEDPLTGTLSAFGVFFIGFVARPIGAAIFGHYGDRIGRKATLIVTLVMTGLATAAVGLVPGYDKIGIWGAIILTVLRLIQGIGVGGEWGGSVLLAMEWARTNKNRGFIASWPQFGAPAGLCLANIMVLLFSWISGDGFLTWGWRIPFLLSIVMVAIGLWIRLGILETPVFQRILAENRVERAPTIEVLKRQPREVVLTALLRLAEQSPGYVFNAFVFSYGTLVLGASRDLLLWGLIVTTALGFITVPIAGAVSDRIGRRRMYIVGCVTVAAYTFVYFALLDTKVPGLMFLAVSLSFIPVMMMYGPEAALIAEAFTPRLRYSGASLGYQLAAIVSGGPAPVIASYLMHRYGTSSAISVYLMVLCAVTIAATIMLKERSGAREEPLAGVEVAAASASPVSS
jgi:MFS family permease